MTPEEVKQELRDTQTNYYSPWAVCEMMGHVRWAGRLSEVERYGGKLARLDIPQKDGTFLTKLFGAAGVYAITFVTEAVARHVAESSPAEPVQPWDFPKALNSPAEPVRHYGDDRPERPTLDHDADDSGGGDEDEAADLPRW